VTLNIFDRKFSVDFPTREDWSTSTECVELVAPDELVFFNDGSLCGGRADVGVFFQTEVYAILACSEYCISKGIVNRAISICSDGRAAFLAVKSYAVSSRVVLQCGDSLRELVLTEFDWCGSLDTVVSMEMRRSTHLQEQDQALLLWGRSLVFRWHLRVSSGGSESGYLNHTALHGAWRLLVVSRECG
jgi:hypothetical protein